MHFELATVDKCTQCPVFPFPLVVGHRQGNGVKGVARNAIALACFTQKGSAPVAAFAALRVCSRSLIRDLAAMLLCWKR